MASRGKEGWMDRMDDDDDTVLTPWGSIYMYEMKKCFCIVPLPLRLLLPGFGGRATNNIMSDIDGPTTTAILPHSPSPPLFLYLLRQLACRSETNSTKSTSTIPLPTSSSSSSTTIESLHQRQHPSRGITNVNGGKSSIA